MKHLKKILALALAAMTLCMCVACNTTANTTKKPDGTTEITTGAPEIPENKTVYYNIIFVQIYEKFPNQQSQIGKF